MKVDLKKSLFILPNLVTLSSVFCGFYVLTLCAGETTSEDFQQAALVIAIAMLLDTIDGRVARITKTQSTIGMQLDSLADVVSFGAVPGILAYKWSLHQLGLIGVLAGFAFLACGTIRLARFNVLSMGKRGTPKKPSKYIVGLPIPPAAGLLIALITANHAIDGNLQDYPWAVFIVVLSASFLMVSTFQFRSFKDIRFSTRTVLFVIVAIGTTLFVAIRYYFSFALVWILGCYVLIALTETILLKIKKQKKNHTLQKTNSQ